MGVNDPNVVVYFSGPTRLGDNGFFIGVEKSADE